MCCLDAAGAVAVGLYVSSATTKQREDNDDGDQVTTVEATLKTAE